MHIDEGENDMKNVDTEKISQEINDALKHRACVMRSGKYLSSYLIHCNRSVDAIRLLARCSIHDISKIQNTEEFLSLASIVDQMDSMHDTSHVLSTAQQDAIRLHWKNNSHHPEFYDNSNDMSDLDIMEMACDCHARSRQYGTDLMEYITKQQELRFHFDTRHFYMLKRYCQVLVDLTINDDYSTVLSDDISIQFNFKDSTMSMLETFDDSVYQENIHTERLFLRKGTTADFASVAYSINTKEDNNEIGYISMKFNGAMECKIFQNYKGNGYGREAISKFVELANVNPVVMTIRREDVDNVEMLKDIGFVVGEYVGDLVTLRYYKEEVKKLEKIPN